MTAVGSAERAYGAQILHHLCHGEGLHRLVGASELHLMYEGNVAIH